jgi:hypothetical protein
MYSLIEAFGAEQEIRITSLLAKRYPTTPKRIMVGRFDTCDPNFLKRDRKW